ncbi:MAG: hypothetical protein C4288_16970 [Leptolyngbya sp. ERB_1_1]
MNLIKSLFSGIFSFIGGIFGGKKKSGYFMELDETQTAKLESVKAQASDAKDAIVEKTKSAVAAVEATAKSAADSVAEGVKDAAATTEATVKSAVKSEAPAKSAVKSAKSKSEKAEPVKSGTAEPNGSANGAKPPVPAETLNLPQPTVSFASEYLVPKPTNSRRRPGANMGAFLDMAKTVKTPNN